MNIRESTPRTAEFLLSEGNGQISREVVTLDALVEALPAGQVLGKLTANSRYVPYDAVATDGSQTAAALLYAPAAASDDTQQVTVIARHAEASAELVVGADSGAVDDLDAVGIIIR